MRFARCACIESVNYSFLLHFKWLYGFQIPRVFSSLIKVFSSTFTRFQSLEIKSFLFLFCISFPQNYKTHYWGPNLLSPSWWLSSYAYCANILKLWALFKILIAVLLCSFCYWKGFQWVLFWGSIQTVKHVFKIESDKIGVVWVCE